MITGLPFYFYFQKLDNLTRIPQSFILCKFKDSGADLLIFRSADPTSLKISFPRENEAIKHDLVEFKVECLKLFCYHGNISTILLFNSIFRTKLLKFLVHFTLLNKLSLREVMAF